MEVTETWILSPLNNYIKSRIWASTDKTYWIRACSYSWLKWHIGSDMPLTVKMIISQSNASRVILLIWDTFVWHFLAVNKGKSLVIFFTSDNIHCGLLSLINPAVYLPNNFFVAWVIVMPNLWVFFLKKRMKYILLLFWN